jgi:hypothetical protein
MHERRKTCVSAAAANANPRSIMCGWCDCHFDKSRHSCVHREAIGLELAISSVRSRVRRESARTNACTDHTAGETGVR